MNDSAGRIRRSDEERAADQVVVEEPWPAVASGV